MATRAPLRTLTTATALVGMLSSSGFADKLLVLKSDGRADAKIRARVDKAIGKLALAGTNDTTLGDITYSDAAAAVGCNPEEASCREEVMSMLAVDEIVTVTVSPSPGGYDVLVRRAGRNGASKDQAAIVDAAGVDHLDSLGVMFGAPSATTSTSTTAITTTPTPAGELEPTSPRPTGSRPTTLGPTTQPGGPNRGEPSDLGSRSNRLHIGGMVTGGALVLVGLVSWGSAASTQNEVNSAPTTTAADLIALHELETRGDHVAALGNVLVIGGLIVGGISTVLYFRHRGRNGSAATMASRGPHLVPTINAHGAGLVLTFGGGL